MSDYNIYSETIPDRMSKSETSEKVEYPEKLIITVDKVDNPTVGEIIKTVRLYILQCKRSGVNPDVILNFCVGYSEGDSHKYIQNYITLAEYIHNIMQTDESLGMMAFVRGNFLSCFIPLLFIGIPVHVTKYTYIEEFNLVESDKYYKGVVERFIEGLGHKIQRPLVIGEQEMIKQNLIIKN